MEKADSSNAQTIGGASAAPMFVEVSTLAPGTRIAQRYRIIRQMGEDNIGVSILVEDTIWGEEIVLKFLQEKVASNSSMVKGFIQELREARLITHPNILNLYDLLVLGPAYVLSFEYFAGRSLAEELKQGPLNVRRGMRIAWDVYRGLRRAHQMGFVHRELTPAYIVVNYAGGVKIVRNFAAAQTVSGKPSDEEVLLRAPMYLAPEHMHQGVLNARSNIYSLGIIMYEMFTGTPPYTAADPVTLLLQHLEGNPTPPRELRPDIPPDLEALILHAMAVDPQNRFESTDDIRRSLVALMRQAPESGTFYP